MNRSIRWFAEVGLADVPLAGSKGANLGELATAKLPVPQGLTRSDDRAPAPNAECRSPQRCLNVATPRRCMPHIRSHHVTRPREL
jgi:hypothetical protein